MNQGFAGMPDRCAPCKGGAVASGGVGCERWCRGLPLLRTPSPAPRDLTVEFWARTPSYNASLAARGEGPDRFFEFFSYAAPAPDPGDGERV